MSEVFKKVAENNVEVFDRSAVNDIDGVEHYVLTYQYSYGQIGINQHLAQAQTELGQANVLDVVAYKESQIAKHQTTVMKKTAALGLFETIKAVDEGGVEFEILDPADVEKYAEVGVSAEAIVEAQVALDKANTIDPVTFKQDLIDAAQDKVDRMALIQAEMDK